MRLMTNRLQRPMKLLQIIMLTMMMMMRQTSFL